MSAHDIGVNSRDQRTRLRTGKKGYGLFLYMCENLRAHLIDQTFANTRREPTRDQVDARIYNRNNADDQSKIGNHSPIFGYNAFIN